MHTMEFFLLCYHHHYLAHKRILCYHKLLQGIQQHLFYSIQIDFLKLQVDANWNSEHSPDLQNFHLDFQEHFHWKQLKPC